jgi:hypothetical protein
MKICAVVVLKICAAPRTVTTVAAWSGDRHVEQAPQLRDGVAA